jgi:hypothetical protein
MKRLNNLLSISFILSVVLLLAINSFAQDPTFGTYYCVEQAKDSNGKLKSSIKGDFTLLSSDAFLRRSAFGETAVASSGTFKVDTQGKIVFSGSNNTDEFDAAVAFPSKSKANRFHVKLGKNIQNQAFTCDLLMDEKQQHVKTSPIYNLVASDIPLTNSVETEIANEFASIFQNSPVQSKSETTVAAKSKDDVSIRTNPALKNGDLKKVIEATQKKVADDPKAKQAAEEYLAKTSVNTGKKDLKLTYNPENIAVESACNDFAIIRNSKTQLPMVEMRLGVSKDGKVLIPPVFETVSYDPCNSYWELGRYYPVKLNGLWGYWDIEKQVMLTDFRFQEVTPFSQGIALVAEPNSKKSFMGSGTQAELDNKIKEINAALDKFEQDIISIRNTVENEANSTFLPQIKRAEADKNRADAVKALRNMKQFQSRQYDYYFNTLLPNLRQKHGATAQIAAGEMIKALENYFKEIRDSIKIYADKAGIKMSELN